MSDIEARVRAAALSFHDVVKEATAAGYRVDMPRDADGLVAIAISETAKVGLVAKPAPGDEYDAMTKAALVELATARGIDIPSSFTKAEVIAALKSPPAPAAI